MARRTHLNSWRTGLRSSARCTLAAWPLRWIGCPPTPRGWIKLRSGLVSCNANSCTRTIFSALTSWSRPSSISLPTTTRRPSRSTGLIPSRNLKRNSERIHNSLDLETALLTALGDPAADRGSIGSRELRLIRFFKEICRVEMLILDDLQHFWDRRSKTILLDASNWLKTFIKETKVSCALVGLPGEAEAVVNTNSQLASLFGDPYRLNPFEWDETDPASTSDEFRNFLSELEDRLPLKKPSHLASYETALRCCAASDGMLRYLMALIQRATRLALDRGQEYLDHNLLSEAFNGRLASERRGVPNPFMGKLPDLETIKNNRVAKQETGVGEGTNRRSHPRDPDSPPRERSKDFF